MQPFPSLSLSHFQTTLTRIYEWREKKKFGKIKKKDAMETGNGPGLAAASLVAATAPR
jgi:hypothetical protein